MGQDEEEEGPGIDIALVEYVRGMRSRKWTIQLGQTYDVGKQGGCVDIEVDHASLSRKHFSLAVTLVEDEPILVAMDHSTHGTFINKSRMEKGNGVKMKVADVRYLVFGECPNGYKFLVKGDASTQKSELKETSSGESQTTEDPTKKHVDAWARGSSESEGDASKKGEGKGRKRPAQAQESQGPSRKERRATGRGEAEPGGSGDGSKVPARKDKSKSSWRSAEGDTIADRVAAKHGTKLPKGGLPADIEWPEDW
eukprot:CAMPEP_0197655004 /NCGR_PEP_ID=MMETSP1338-20131121/39190_1 /TAXON_ID=43686 ORGANISM="Pelagodinium beii, Strain RCC1491" /NCGR_SAMPLE_ID=MMETSP1338 /ASSEMBLY_ACC=CAM_ASM_000754 /LENGTH=253 /DNA_ID=CAMNT_0043230563 /DNA_START=19 /DNA_END=777 /DNA_ORIENTATION=+